MSIFWLGGPNVIIPDTEITREMYDDRYFMPGIIHGNEDTIIRVYLNDAVEEILSAEAENFACYNDGSGDFASLWAEWPKTATMTSDELAKWAGVKAIAVKRADVPEFLGQIIDTFEDFLEEKGIDIPNDEKDDCDDPESAAIIYGTDYGNLQSALEELMLG